VLNPLQLLPIVIGQAFAKQTLERTPECQTGSAVMDEAESVLQYNDAMQSKLAIVYAGALERIHRIRRRTEGGRAIDLCCGPGHFTLLLAKYFDYEEVVGVDLSEPMIEAANQNAREWGLSDRVRFEVADATNYDAESGAFDLVTSNDAAHHLPTLEIVKQLVAEMDRLTNPLGMAQLTDLVRLKNQSITERYTRVIGRDYLDRGLARFQDDFRNSMQAAWTGKELRTTQPNKSNKLWQHHPQKLLPTVQFVTGYPNDGRPVYIRNGMPWTPKSQPVPKSLQRDWQLFRRLI
jgi:ubiquinone/menaquinone biosynthesis C-methylase UbiE